MKKICKRCGLEKDVAGFYSHVKMSDGLLSFCKTCTKTRILIHRNKNIKRIRAYDSYRRRPANMSQKQIERKRKYQMEYRKRRRKQVNACNHVQRKLVDQRPNICSNCGTKTKIVGHHFDYNKPINVVWLCQSCHVKLHRNL